MRQLATIRKIKEINPIKNADAIEVATVDGWQVVIKKDDFKVGDTIIYFEIDSWIPTELAPFLSKGKEPRIYNDIKGERLRTIKLRKQISQGLILPFNILPNSSNYTLGDDVSDILGIQKWEREIPAELRGQVKGDFPNHTPKSDQERIQNIYDEYKELYNDEYEASLKLDGTSCTIFIKDLELGVCSRNLELKINEENKDNTYVKIVQEFEETLFKLNRNISIQGELMGSKIQGNREQLKTHKLFVYNIWDIEEQRWFNSKERLDFCEKYGFDIAPILGIMRPFDFTLEELLKKSEIPSMVHPIAEGIVYKNIKNPSISFKAINNKFLLKGGD